MPTLAIPGPKLWAITSIPYIVMRQRGYQHTKLLSLHEKYGKIVRVTPNELSIIDGGVWKDVWAHRQGHAEFGKDRSSGFKHPNGIVGILFAEREDHSRYRRLLSHSFSEKGMREQQQTITSYVDSLIKGLREESSGGEAVDMAKWFNWTTFDIIGRLSFGEDFGCLQTATIHPWIESVFGNVKAILTIIAFDRLGLGWLLPYVASKKLLASRTKNWEFVSDRMEARIQKGIDQHDFFDSVLKHMGEEKGMTIEEMKSNASNLVLAGSETTATLLSGTIHHLLQNPTALYKATTEIRTAFTSISDITLFSTSKLKYTLAVLEECMRIYPPVPNPSPRVVPPGGSTVLNYHLPAGTVLQFPHYAAYRYSAHFKDAEMFVPERWLGGEEFKGDSFGVVKPFSVGPRNCIGKNLAYAEMRLILARFLFVFDVEGDEKMGMGTEWMEQKTFVLWEKGPLWVRLRAVN